MANPVPARLMPASAQKILQLISPVLWILALFLSAGRADWTRGWIGVAVYIGGMATVGIVARRFNKQLMQERYVAFRQNTKSFDRPLVIGIMSLALVQPIVAGLDAVRFGWSSMPFEYVYAGIVVFAAGSAVIAWTLATNPFAEASVRIQTERGHRTVSNGPYRFVRHPMYAGAILMYFATPMLLGSVWSFAISAAIAVLLMWRAVLEERTLQAELPGYDEYARRTRYRVVPAIW